MRICASEPRSNKMGSCSLPAASMPATCMPLKSVNLLWHHLKLHLRMDGEIML